jgi:hypothetical protein
VTVSFTTEDSETASQPNRGHREIFSKGFLKIFRWASLYFLCALCGLGLPSCGRKGPPLAPLLKLPGPVGGMTAKRLGSDVALQFVIPAANTDSTRPASLERVEVYAHTGPLPTPADFLKYGTLIGNVAVKAPAADTPPAGEQLPGLDQGAVAGVSETITPAQMEVGKMPISRNRAAVAAVPPVTRDLETEGTVNAPLPLMRYYVAVGVSRKNRRGAFSAPLAMPLSEPFVAPTALQGQYTEEAVTLTWEPIPPTHDIFAPAPGYNVYEVQDPAVTTSVEGPPVAGAPALNSTPLQTLKKAVNPAPLPLTTFKDPRTDFGTRRCYVVRSVRLVGAIPVESAASPPVCLTLTDTFPPAPPKSLNTVATEGAINLIWEPNTEKDLGGYVVLRGEAPGETLTPLTPVPIHETTYHDSTVKPGVTYVYAVVAVDTAPTPNTSQYSNLATEVAR